MGKQSQPLREARGNVSKLEVEEMRRVSWLLLVLLLLPILDGCAPERGSNGKVVAREPVLQEETPKDVIEKLLQALKGGDTATAETCFREDYRMSSGPFGGKRIDLVWLSTEGLGLGERRLYKYEVGNPAISGNTARVNVVSWRRVRFDTGG